MPTVNVKVTVATTVTGAGKAISISVEKDPVDISNQSTDVEVAVEWELVNSQGWDFVHTHQGIKIHAPAAKFKNNGSMSNWQKHGCVRNKKQKDGNDYKYTISVTDGTTTATWDPWMRN